MPHRAESERRRPASVRTVSAVPWWVGAVAIVGVLAAAAAIGVSSREPATADAGEAAIVARVAGDDRYATAGALAQHVEGDTLWVTSGRGFADALVAAAAGTGPVLLVEPDDAPEATLEAAGTLTGIERVRAVGGPAAIDDAAVTAVADAVGADDVERLSGADRHATAAEVARELHDSAEVAYLATGEDFPDALTGAAAAAEAEAPLLLTWESTLPEATTAALAALGVDEVVLIGGEAAVSSAVADELADRVDRVHRVEGDDRYATAAEVSAHRDLDGPELAYLATGEDFPDVLAAAPAAVSREAALLLTRRSELHDATLGELRRLGVERVRVAGGPAAVAHAVVDELWRELGPETVVESVAEGFDAPWGLAFVPGTELLLVTEKRGELAVVDTATGEVERVPGVPQVDASGQGGLLDIEVDPAFPDSAWVYLTYSASDGSGATSTHLARARLDLDGGLDAARLADAEVLFAAEPFVASAVHYGSRVAIAPDGRLLVTVGDRGSKDFDDHPSQDPSTTIGTTVRLEPDGSIPPDNPFIDDPDVADEIYTYGHRNVQGMTIHPETGEVWQSEHGERDGDEINVLEPGGNFGWPVAHTGCHYGTTDPVGDHPSEREDTVDPRFAWECTSGGFPPAGMTFSTGEAFPAWDGDLLVGGLASRYLARFTVEDNGDLAERDPLLADEGWRIRDVAVGPHDGAVYLAIDDTDVPLIRLVPDDD